MLRMPKSSSTYKQKEKLLKWIWAYSTAPPRLLQGAEEWARGRARAGGNGGKGAWAGERLAGRKSPTSRRRRRLTESPLSRDGWGKPTTDRWKPVGLMFCKSALCHTQKAERDSACPTRRKWIKWTQRKTQISDFIFVLCLIIINVIIN